MKKTKINKKEAGFGPFLKKNDSRLVDEETTVKVYFKTSINSQRCRQSGDVKLNICTGTLFLPKRV